MGRASIRLMLIFVMLSLSAWDSVSLASTASAQGILFKVTVASAYLRSEPALTAPRVASVFKGQVLPLSARTADSQWVEVNLAYLSKRGWINAAWGVVEGNLDSLPVETINPASTTPAPVGPVFNSAVESELSASPVTPVVSARAIEIYQNGLSQGAHPKHFSKIGDCQAVPSHFLSVFDSPTQYRLGKKYAYLQETINQFSGSFSRSSEAVRAGFNIASVLSPLWADPKACRRGETPLQCEFRLHHPSIVMISMETWWSGDPQAYEANLRQVVDFSLNHGALPILATKADNLEGNQTINLAIVRVAKEYELPLWNFWLAVQPLPGHGLTEDAFHLTFRRPFFDDPRYLQSGWAMRNLTALQSLDAIWQAVK